MIQQFLERLFPKTPEPKPLTLQEQRELVEGAHRLSVAVREYLYQHRSYGTHGKFSEKPNHNVEKCAACIELQAALDET